ncbi:NAD(P)H-binding protein [Micromonospora sp. NBC_01813]|uniref:NAD(P)H-binding protein n=1 Tax=Micromonospora sp. NBC_01813 TaxID=2975988 RepID=UPI002DDA5D4D|nr:NAD(P)H-binding protein [Micromonospora sp. NBC_01813]WSA07493.1 NAD(P)H-binding protein [Micromonospora sp. NBC_01813]
MTTLVTGATGNVGRIVVTQLVEAGDQVRAMTRTPRSARFPAGVDVVPGDLDDPSTLAAALHGVDRMYLFPVAATAPEVVRRAKQAGVRRIVVLSSGAVTGGYDTDFHLPVERAVEDSGLEWTHVRPGEFMLNKLWLWGPSIRTESVVHEAFPDVAWCPVHERDIAGVATAALREDGHHGKAYDLNGPELLTCRQQVDAIAAAIGRPVRLDVVTAEQAREIYREQGGFAADNADFLLGFEDYSGGESEPEDRAELDLGAEWPLPTSEQVTGRPARTFLQWAHDHAAELS